MSILPNKPILCLDFDGVLHSYTGGWKGAAIVADGPVPGMAMFLETALQHFDVQVYSSRSHQPGGIEAMKGWLATHILAYTRNIDDDTEFRNAQAVDMMTGISFPLEKPSAMVTLDDRAIQFTGKFPDPQDLLKFRPWNKIESKLLGDHPLSNEITIFLMIRPTLQGAVGIHDAAGERMGDNSEKMATALASIFLSGASCFAEHNGELVISALLMGFAEQALAHGVDNIRKIANIE